MGIKRINEIYDAIKGASADNLFSDQLYDMSRESLTEFERAAENAKNIILGSIDEREFVKLMMMAQKITVSAGLLDGNRQTFLADMSGELQGYTHTVVLAVIGALIEDEIL